MRRRLVDALRERGITDEAVLAAIGGVPRHFFLDKAFEEHAYEDKAFSIGYEQTISQPYTVAYQTSLLRLSGSERVLEIGTGSGYQAAILAAMGAKVYSMERLEALYLQAKDLFARLQLPGVHLFFGDGTLGLPALAPFDHIIVTAGAPVLPADLGLQLKIGGTLVVPVGVEVQLMHRISRVSVDRFEQEVLDPFRFVPFLKGTERQQ